MVEAFHPGVERSPVGDGEKDQIGRLLEPVAEQDGMLVGEQEGGVTALDGLLAGGEVTAGQDVQFRMVGALMRHGP